MKKLLAFALSSFLVFSMCACSTGTDSVENSDNTQASSTEKEEEKSKETKNETFSMGEEITIGDWKIIVNGLEFLDTVEDDFMVFSPENGGKFGVVSVSVTNNGKSANKLLPTVALDGEITAKLLYDDGYEFISTSLLTDFDAHDKVLNPLTSAEGIIAFEVPETVATDDKPLTIEFSVGDVTSKTSVSVKIR